MNMHFKYILPLGIRDQLRPAWQIFQRQWNESALSSKPPEWRQAKARAHAECDNDRLLEMARTEFGITQIRSEIIGLLSRLNDLEPKIVVEVGTHKGGNSFLFCHAVPSVNLVIGIDLAVQNSAKLIHFTRSGQKYCALHGNSQTREMVRRAQKNLRHQEVDFLFIDGDHSYNGARADYELYSPLVRKGGIIAFHDIVPDHKTRFGKPTGCYAGEVYKLWAEIKKNHRHEELIDNPDQDGFGIGIIYV